MPFPDIDPIAFAIGPFAIRWYALGYLFGVLLGAAYGYLLLARRQLWHRGEPPFPAKDIWDFAFWPIVGIVLGGRIGYVLFYNFPFYAANPGQIVALWDGGMSFHGGLLGVFAAVWWWSWRRGLLLMDTMEFVAPIVPPVAFRLCASRVAAPASGSARAARNAVSKSA